jgi:hypothetical protein
MRGRFGGGYWIHAGLCENAPIRGAAGFNGVRPVSSSKDLRRRIYYYDWSRDGTRMALAYGDDTRDVVLMKGFAARP